MLGTVGGSKRLDVASGWFNSTTMADLATVRVGSDNGIYVNVVSYDQTLENPVTSWINTGEQAPGAITDSDGYPAGAVVRVATGDFDGDGWDEIVMAWVGGSNFANVKAYAVAPDLSAIAAKGKTSDETGSGAGHLAVAVGAYDGKNLTAQPPTWWQTVYDKPDPAFNLPWKYNDPPDAYNLLSKEITFNPPSPTAGQIVTVTAKVRNYSLVGVDNVVVRLYNGDPDAGGAQFARQTIAQLNPLSAASVVAAFNTSGYANQSLNIYARIDPNTPVPEDIAFDPATPIQGQTVHISATVRAQGNTYTYVTVMFYDGDPRRGGKFIGGDLVYLIAAGTTATAGIPWNTAGVWGTHDIWVVIGQQADEEDISTDNRAHKTIYLPFYRLYLPLELKGSS